MWNSRKLHQSGLLDYNVTHMDKLFRKEGHIEKQFENLTWKVLE